MYSEDMLNRRSIFVDDDEVSMENTKGSISTLFWLYDFGVWPGLELLDLFGV
jgi:hypothetical protein